MPRRLCARPTRFLSLALFVISLFWILSNRSLGEIRALERPIVQAPAWHAASEGDPAVPKANMLNPGAQAPLRPAGGQEAAQESRPAGGAAVADNEEERKKKQEQDEERARQERERKEHEMRVQFEAEYAVLET